MKQLNNPWLGIEGYNCFACAPSNPIGLPMPVSGCSMASFIISLIRADKSGEFNLIAL